MGIRHENLDAITRGHMLEEIQIGDHYMSPRLTAEGLAAWPGLMQEAAQHHNDDWLAQQLINRNLLRSEESYTRDGVTRTRRINQPHAAQQLGEGEFNRYYIRGLCQRAEQEGKNELVIYRGKDVNTPRPESEVKIGTGVSTQTLLTTLRRNDFVTIEDAIGVPGGPNSGLTCRLP
ncbi:hypothetical protein [Rhodanobacter soli]|uniref:hypothetical protein n=1 Tax=Rhodanobacter soli TaxID=590609 RepID=UPI0031E34DCB